MMTQTCYRQMLPSVGDVSGHIFVPRLYGRGREVMLRFVRPSACLSVYPDPVVNNGAFFILGL